MNILYTAHKCMLMFIIHILYITSNKGNASFVIIDPIYSSTVSPLLPQTPDPLLQSCPQASTPLNTCITTRIVIVGSGELHILVLALATRQQHRVP